jgi:hypothetical protein
VVHTLRIQNDILRHISRRLAIQARYISSYRSFCLLYFSPTLRTQVYVISLRPSYATLYITSLSIFFRTWVSPTLHNQSTSLLRYGIYNNFTSLYYATVYTTLRLSTTLRYIHPLYVSLLRLQYATIHVTGQRFRAVLTYLLCYGTYNQSTSTNVP